MRRDYIVVTGAQGCGKSVWAKQYTSSTSRLLVYDPTRSYPVNYDWDQRTGEEILIGKHKHFRIGIDNGDDLDMLCDMSYVSGDTTLLIEEAGVLFGRGQKLTSSVRRVIFMGRHRRVNLLLLAQRAVSIPVDLRSQANRFVSFRQIEEQDVAAVSGIMGKQYKSVLPALPELRCLDWCQGKVVAYDLQVGNIRANVSEREPIAETQILNNEED